MSLRKTLLAARNAQTSVFIPFVMAGDPSLGRSADVLLALENSGAGLIELGIPFSDPVADGITVQRAAERGLNAGATLPRVLEMLSAARTRGLTIPVCLFSYVNPVFHMGYDAFARAAKDNGANGALIVDLPPEEAGDYLTAMAAHGLETVFLCSPTTSPERLRVIDAASTGFVYYVSREGVTGAQTDLPATLADKLSHLKTQLQNPLAVGFGISSHAHVAALRGRVDGIVVGSALVKIIEDHPQDAALQIGLKTRELCAA